jgi:hypothetical protein
LRRPAAGARRAPFRYPIRPSPAFALSVRSSSDKTLVLPAFEEADVVILPASDARTNTHPTSRRNSSLASTRLATALRGHGVSAPISSRRRPSLPVGLLISCPQWARCYWAFGEARSVARLRHQCARTQQDYGYSTTVNCSLVTRRTVKAGASRRPPPGDGSKKDRAGRKK